MTRQTVALLLDSAPINWTSQEDRHLKLCETLSDRDVKPVLIFSQPLSEEFQARFKNSGAIVETINYGEGCLHFSREFGKLVKKHSISTAHIIFFDYFSVVPWIVRINGIRNIVYEMQNSGIFKATSWKKSLLHLRTSVTTRPMTRVIAISEFVKEQLVKGGLPENKVIVRYLGVDTRRFEPNPSAREQWNKDFNVHPEELFMSTVSYLRPFKNPQVLVEASSILKERSVPARLFVAGDGEMLPELKELSVRSGVSDRIHWLGNLDEPRSLLQASDVFLLASVGEAFGLVLAEAMACAVPVVGSRSGALLEIVQDGRTGLLAAPLNADSFADSIEHLARNPDVRKRMAKEACERVRQSFTIEKAVKETINIYETMWES